MGIFASIEEFSSNFFIKLLITSQDVFRPIVLWE